MSSIWRFAAVLLAGFALALPGASARAEGPASTAGPFDSPLAKVITCAACHGVNGNSRSDVMPIIAGMDAAYFKKQIAAYAGGARPSPEMGPYSKQVLDIGVDQVAAFFAGQKMEPTPIKVDPAAVARGRAAAGVCVTCHGPTGKGDPSKGTPALAGQAPGYLRDQIRLFKQDARNPGEAALAAVKAVMQTVPDERIPDIAAYYSSLR
jgi:cytochrome c553